MRVVILGNHKSGTTLIAQTLGASGIPVVPDDLPNAGYDGGHKYEWPAFRDINHQLLNSRGVYSLNIACKPVHTMAPDIESAAQELVQEVDAAYDRWGFKDPRTMLTYDAWRPVLGEHKLVGVFRHPGQFVRHYRKRDPTRSFRRWCQYARMLIEHKQRFGDELHLIDYADFMTSDDPIEALSAHLGTEITDVRKPNLYRNRQETSLRLSLGRAANLPLGFRDRPLYDELRSLRDAK